MSEPGALDPIRLTRELVEIESTTYHEGAVGDFLAGFLEDRGWEVEKTPVPQPPESRTAGDRWNVYAGTSGQQPDLVFSTHMDTVPPHIPFSEDADFMYGRGVSDAKGIIAAQCAAAEILRADGFRIGLLFVSGEERDSAGAIVANDDSARQPLPGQRRTDRQSPGPGVQGSPQRSVQSHRQDGPLGVPGARRQRHSQAG